MTTTLEISMISASGYKSRHTQPECGYALEPSRWTEYSIHTMDPYNLELIFEFFEVILISVWPLIAHFTDKLYYLASCNCLDLMTGGHECTCCRRRCSSRTSGHRLPPLLVLLREWQGQRSRHTSNNGAKLQTDNRESQRLKQNPKAPTVLCFFIMSTLSVSPASVDYLVIRPIQGQQCDMSSCFIKYWKKRSAVDVGHRGAGSSHTAKWVTNSHTGAAHSASRLH